MNIPFLLCSKFLLMTMCWSHGQSCCSWTLQKCLRSPGLYNYIIVFFQGYLGIGLAASFPMQPRARYAFVQPQNLSLPALHILILVTRVTYQAPSLLTSSAQHGCAYSEDEPIIYFLDCPFRFFCRLCNLVNLYTHAQHGARAMRRISARV
jgi:hypothetical protein